MLTTFAVISLCVETNEHWGFIIALVAALLMGLVQAIGEFAILGFLEAFPLSAWWVYLRHWLHGDRRGGFLDCVHGD